MSKQSAYEAKIPDASGHIHYTEEENSVWRDLVARQLPAVDRHMARPYRDGLARMALPLDRVPQCSDLSATLGGG